MTRVAAAWALAAALAGLGATARAEAPPPVGAARPAAAAPPPAAPPAADDAGAGRAAFYAALARARRGQAERALAELDALARARPDDPFADDALYQAAELAEDELGDPAGALGRYRALLASYPQSRLARRAQNRIDFLARGLAGGAEPLRRYRACLGGYASRPRPASIACMEEVVRRWPDFPLADQAAHWLATAYAQADRRAEALALYAEILRRFPASEAAHQARRGRAELLLRAGDAGAARREYGALRAFGDPAWDRTADAGEAAVRRLLLRRGALWVALGYLALFAALHLRLLRPLRPLGAWLRPPLELRFFAPVAALFVAAAASEHGRITQAVVEVALGGAVLVHLGARVAERHAGRYGPGRRALHAGAVTLAALALAYVAAQSSGLVDTLIETARFGADPG